MRILVTYGSKLGGTEGIARTIAEALQAKGFDVDVVAAHEARGLGVYDAVIAGGAIYANRWHRAARHFVDRHEAELRRVPVWFFSSGPLDASAGTEEIPPVPQLQVLLDRVGAQGHMTFGGRLSPDARGFPARAMAKQRAGDWRDLERVRAWAQSVAEALPSARPRPFVEQPGRRLLRLVLHAAAGWVVFRGTMLALAWIDVGAARALGALVAVPIFALIAWSYFRVRGARRPLPAAAAFAGVVGMLDLVVAELFQSDHVILASIRGFWLPLVAIFLMTWATGAVISTMPWTTQAHAR